jgi:heptosyltransferase-2
MLEEELACQPCGLHGHRKCPLNHFHCAHGIQTSQLLAVLAEAESVKKGEMVSW